MRLQQTAYGLQVLAPAKLNLFLDIRGRRPDDYHDLETVFVAVNLWDELLISSSPRLEFHLEYCGLPLSAGSSRLELKPESNLVLRAARLLWRATGQECGAHIFLRKRIPWEAGLGGGSADAAVALAGLNRWWNCGLTQPQLLELAAELGSDVPFFLAQSPLAIGRGRGEILTPCQLARKLHFVIVKPETGLSTAAVFRELSPGIPPVDLSQFLVPLERGLLSCAAQRLHNRLLDPAQKLSPAVAQTRQEFSRIPLLGHTLSGSGTSYFGWCVQRQQADHVAGLLRARGYRRVYVVQSVA